MPAYDVVRDPTDPSKVVSFSLMPPAETEKCPTLKELVAASAADGPADCGELPPQIVATNSTMKSVKVI